MKRLPLSEIIKRCEEFARERDNKERRFGGRYTRTGYRNYLNEVVREGRKIKRDKYVG